MRRRILALTTLHLVLAALLGGTAWGVGAFGRPTLGVLPFAAAVAMVGSLRMNVELGRHACSVTMVEAVVVCMLLHLAPAGILAAAVLGEVVACGWQRQAPSKLMYNASSAASAAMVAATLYHLLHAAGAADGAMWMAALLSGCAYATAALKDHSPTEARLPLVEVR